MVTPDIITQVIMEVTSLRVHIWPWTFSFQRPMFTLDPEHLTALWAQAGFVAQLSSVDPMTPSRWTCDKCNHSVATTVQTDSYTTTTILSTGWDVQDPTNRCQYCVSSSPILCSQIYQGSCFWLTWRQLMSEKRNLNISVEKLNK